MGNVPVGAKIKPELMGIMFARMRRKSRINAQKSARASSSQTLFGNLQKPCLELMIRRAAGGRA